MGPTSSPPGVFTLNDSNNFPGIGFGGYDDTGAEVEAVKKAILTALKIGYRHIDSASFYTTEKGLGLALQEAFSSGLVKREELFLTTKIAPNQLHVEQIISAIKTSLSNLQLDYVDLYLIHWPYRTKPGSDFFSNNADDYLPLDLKRTWAEMEKLVELGLTRSIGVSNFNVKILKQLLSVAKIPPAVNQIELHPQWQQDKLRAFCKKVNVLASAWSPLGAPNSLHGSLGTLENPIMKEIAVKHGKSVAQIALRWIYELGCCPLPKSFNEKRMAENYSIWDFSLTEEDHEKIKEIPQTSICTGPIFAQFQSAPWKTFEEFWDEE